MLRPIERDTRPLALAHAVQQNLFALVPTFARWPGMQAGTDAGLRWMQCDVPFPLFNGVMAAALDDSGADAAIDAALARFADAGVPALWWTTPSDRPDDLEHRLLARGLAPIANVPGMALKLDGWRHDAEAIPGLRVERVADAATLATWSEVCVGALELPPFVLAAMQEMMPHMDPSSTAAYIAWLDGAPVATSFALRAAGVVGIYNVATLPAARRRGAAAAVTAAPLRDAQADGYRVAILHASDMAESLYRRMGFEEQCRIGQFLYQPPG